VKTTYTFGLNHNKASNIIQLTSPLSSLFLHTTQGGVLVKTGQFPSPPANKPVLIVPMGVVITTPVGDAH